LDWEKWECRSQSGCIRTILKYWPWNRSEEPRKEFEAAGGKTFSDLGEMALALTDTPRIFLGHAAE